MIGAQELIDRIAALEIEVLDRWIELGWIVPTRSPDGPTFDDAEAARVQLVCDLVYDLEIDEESLPVILSLLDQLHDARRLLRTLSIVINELPQDMRDQIRQRLTSALSGG
jgi:chaperone modulatory protein CbpM